MYNKFEDECTINSSLTYWKIGILERESMKADVIKKYFQSWIDKDIEIVKQTFSENALYSECYGRNIMAYHKL